MGHKSTVFRIGTNQTHPNVAVVVFVVVVVASFSVQFLQPRFPGAVKPDPNC